MSSFQNGEAHIINYLERIIYSTIIESDFSRKAFKARNSILHNTCTLECSINDYKVIISNNQYNTRRKVRIMKRLFAVLVFLVLAVSACVAPTQEVVEDDTHDENTLDDVIEDTSEETDDDSASSTIVEIEETENVDADDPAVSTINEDLDEDATAVEDDFVPTTQEQKQLQALKDKANAIEMYEFTAHFDPDFTRPYTVKVFGDKARVETTATSLYDRANFYDTIYLDYSDRSAEAYCERTPTSCDDPNKRYDVDFDDYNIKTPIEWINDLPGDAEYLNSQQFDGRTGVGYGFMQDGKEIHVFIDEFFGVPLYVVEDVDGEDLRREYTFKGKDVMPTDVEHQEYNLE